MVTISKRNLLLAAAVLWLCAEPALAVPLPGGTAGFGIAPARRHVVGNPGMALTPTTVINGTSSSYQVSVFPAILTQELSGAFDFVETPRSLNDSKLVMTASPGSFVMAPGTTRPVDLRWNMLPGGHKWIAMGVVFQGFAAGQSGTVHVITRLLSVNFLSLPGLTKVNGVFTGLYAEQSAPRVLRFLARVENTGDRFAAPSAGRLVLSDSLGRVVFSEPWMGDVVLPGAQRDFPIDVRTVLPAGRYTATVTMRFGGERSRSTSFTLVGPNQLPTPAITIRDFNANGVIGSPAKVTARILSSGTAPAGLTMHLYLANASDASPGATALATAQVSYRNLVPGSVTQLSHPLGGGLHAGSYRVIATWVDPTGAQHTAQADFTPTAGHSLSQRIWSFIQHHVIFLIGLLVMALVMALAYTARRLRGGQREIQAELAAMRAQLQAATLDDHAPPGKPAASRSSRLGTGMSTRPKAKSSATTKARPRSAVKSDAARSNGASAETNSSAAKAATPAKAKPRAKATGARSAGVTPARARLNRAKANGATTNGAKAKPNRAKANGARANGATATQPAAKPNGAKATGPTRRSTHSAGPGAPVGNGHKPTARKATAVKANGVKANGVKANGVKANGSGAGASSTRRKTTGVNPSKSNGAASNGSKPAPRSRSAAAESSPAAIVATPTQTASTPPNQSGTGADLTSTDVRANRAGELLALASRSHARRPLPSDRDDA